MQRVKLTTSKGDIVIELDAAEALRVEGDARMDEGGLEGLAALIVSDMILYNGDEILGAASVAEAKKAVADDLEVARDLLEQVAKARGEAPPSSDLAGEAFARLMRELGRDGGRP